MRLLSYQFSLVRIFRMEIASGCGAMDAEEKDDIGETTTYAVLQQLDRMAIL